MSSVLWVSALDFMWNPKLADPDLTLWTRPDPPARQLLASARRGAGSWWTLRDPHFSQKPSLQLTAAASCLLWGEGVGDWVHSRSDAETEKQAGLCDDGVTFWQFCALCCCIFRIVLSATKAIYLIYINHLSITIYLSVYLLSIYLFFYQSI